MADDSEPIEVTGTEKGDGAPTLLSAITKSAVNIPYKSLIFLFIIFILITSDVFSNAILKKMSGATDEYGKILPYGAVIQGLMLVISYMILNFLITREVI
jgi:hypothetical protein